MFYLESPKLTTKQELFIAAYLGEAHGNATEAARIAGYAKPEASGKENLRKPPIAARVKAKVDKAHASADQVLEKLSEIAFAPSFEYVEILSRDKSGKPIKVKMDLGNQVKSLELLGKYHQLFVDKQQIELDGGVRVEIVGMSEEDLP